MSPISAVPSTGKFKEFPVGFAGKRTLFPGLAADAPEEPTLRSQVESFLADRLRRLALELGLSSLQELVGISQIACGADMFFTLACRRAGIRQRIFLPQPREAYLGGSEPSGLPDFTVNQRTLVNWFLDESRILEERVVSASPDRETRFIEANLAILAASRIVICLLDASGEQTSLPGGTVHLLDAAIACGTCALEIRATRTAGLVSFREQWHGDLKTLGRDS